MKRFLLTILLFLIQISIYSQKTVEKIEYWDIWKLKPATIWYELGDGTKHGTKKEFRENGSLISKTNYEYGKLLNYTKYYQDGSIFILRNNNTEGKAHGIQQWYEFNEGKRWLKANAKIDNGKLLEYAEYYSSNKPKLLFANDGAKKEFTRYDENGNKIANLKIENGKISGYSDSGIIFNNNLFESIKIKGLSLEKEGKFYCAKIDGVNENEYPYAGYYIIPDSTSFDFDSQFSYNEYLGIPEFSMVLNLIVFKGEIKQSSLQLNYLEYRPTEAFSSTFIRSYIKEHLTQDSLFCEYQQGSNFQKKRREFLIRKNAKIWEKEYWENGNLKSVKENKITKEYNETGTLILDSDGNELKEFFETGELKNHSNVANGTIKKYFKNGRLKEEENLDERIIYNEEGKILENKELRKTKKILEEELVGMKTRYIEGNKEIELLLKDKLYFDLSTGSFYSNITTKENEYVLLAFKLLFIDYAKRNHAIVDVSKRTLKKLGYSDDLTDTNAVTDLNEENKMIEKAINNCKQDLMINENFIKTIDMFDSILKSSDLRKINRSLKSVTTSDEVRSILKL